jgi:hypothetical protein
MHKQNSESKTWTLLHSTLLHTIISIISHTFWELLSVWGAYYCFIVRDLLIKKDVVGNY